MKFLLTPASRRAVDFAANWTTRADSIELGGPALLLGLLSESECRAATMLARCGIDAEVVRRRWPELAKVPAASRAQVGPIAFSDEVQVSLELAQQRLARFPKPLELATEHILLGLTTTDYEIAVWLRRHGLEPNTLDAEIHALYGYSSRAAREGQPIEVPDVEIRGTESRKPEAESGREELADECLAGGLAHRVAGTPEIAVLRVLDAAANRAREAIRVVEDYVRFVLDDRHLTGLCKRMRHELTDALAFLSGQQRLAARETRADVGTELTVASEQSRQDAADMLAANFARLQEALRSLEEFGKLAESDRRGSVDLAAACKQLRYRVYTLQRAVEITRGSVERLASARLYAVIDGRDSVDEFRRLAGSLIASGVHVIQLRDKRLSDRALIERAKLLRALTAVHGTLMIVNDRPDLAALANADGVHIGQEELTVKDARTIVGPEALVGVSTHSIEQARQAVLDGANYIGVGPVFPSGTKQFEHFPGVDLLRAVAAEIRLPAFAIGGIDRGNLDQVLATGFSRIAVGGAITTADDPGVAARKLLARLDARADIAPISD